MKTGPVWMIRTAVAPAHLRTCHHPARCNGAALQKPDAKMLVVLTKTITPPRQLIILLLCLPFNTCRLTLLEDLAFPP